MTFSSSPERRPIGFRSPSNQIPFAVRSGGVRLTMTFLHTNNNFCPHKSVELFYTCSTLLHNFLVYAKALKIFIRTDYQILTQNTSYSGTQIAFY